MSDGQPNPTFFFDGTHGKMIPELLKAVGISVRIHRNMGWIDNMLDVDWIAECGKNDWAIISGDKSIERVPEERQAVINAKCKVFMLDDSHDTRTEDWAAALLVGRQRLVEIADKAEGPFFVTVKRCKVYGHLSSPRFISSAGAGWKPIVEKIAPPQPTQGNSKPVKRKQQGVFTFPSDTLTSEVAFDAEDDIMIEIEDRNRKQGL